MMKVIFTKIVRFAWVIVLLLTSSCMAAELSTSRGWFATKGLGARAITQWEASALWLMTLQAFIGIRQDLLHSQQRSVNYAFEHLWCGDYARLWWKKGRKAGLMWEAPLQEQLAGFPAARTA